MHHWSIALVMQVSSLFSIGTPAEKAVQPAVAQCVVHSVSEVKGTYVITMSPGANAANTTGQLTILDAQHLPVRILPVLFNGKDITRTIKLQGLNAGTYYLHLSGDAQAAQDVAITVE